MTIGELIDTLIARRKGLGYKLWKEAYLVSWATMGKSFPKRPEKASPELFTESTKKTIPMPHNLLAREIEKRGGKVNYE